MRRRNESRGESETILKKVANKGATEEKTMERITAETKVGELVGWQFVSPAQQEAKREYAKKRELVKKERDFFMFKRDNFSQVRQELSLGEVGVVMFLARYLKQGTGGKVFYRGEQMNVSTLTKLLGKSKSQVERILNELETRSIVFRVKSGRDTLIELNSEFMVAGSLGSKDKFIKVFKVELGEVAKQLSLNELGFLLILLESVNWKTHILCENPDEGEGSELVILERADLAELTGLGRNFINRTLNKLYNLRVLAEVRTVNRAIVVHPRFVSRQQVTPTWDDIVEAIDNGITKANYRKNKKK